MPHDASARGRQSIDQMLMPGATRGGMSLMVEIKFAPKRKATLLPREVSRLKASGDA